MEMWINKRNIERDECKEDDSVSQFITEKINKNKKQQSSINNHPFPLRLGGEKFRKDGK
jgi:hypothetical protein